MKVEDGDLVIAMIGDVKVSGRVRKINEIYYLLNDNPLCNGSEPTDRNKFGFAYSWQFHENINGNGYDQHVVILEITNYKKYTISWSKIKEMKL